MIRFAILAVIILMGLTNFSMANEALTGFLSSYNSDARTKNESLLINSAEINTKAVEEAKRFGQHNLPINYNPNTLIYSGYNQIPEHPTTPPPNEKTLYFFFKRYNNYYRQGPVHYESNPAQKYYEFETELRDVPFVKEQLQKTGLISYLHYEDGKLVVDEKVSPDRFGGEITDDRKLWSASIAKSMTSYLLGHAICEGFIDSVDHRLTDWPLIKNTLYDGQKILDLLNMRAGDQEYVSNWELRSTGVYPGDKALRYIFEDELKASVPAKPLYNYNELPVNVLLNYIIFKSGDKFQDLLDTAFQRAAKTKDSVLFIKKRMSEIKKNQLVLNIEGDYAAVANFYATRHDYLRIAIAMLDAWKADNCLGNYLKTIFKSGQRKGQERGKPLKPTQFITTNFRSYAGFFHTEYYKMRDRKILSMHGYGGQHIWIDFDNSRIVTTNAIHGNFDWSKIIESVIKSGKIKTGNWN